MSTNWLSTLSVVRGAFRFDAPRYLAEQVALIQRNVPMAVWGAAMTATAMAGMHHAINHDTRVLWWAGIELLLCLLSGWAVSRSAAASPRMLVMRQAQLLCFLAALQGLAWGALAWWFMRTPIPATLNLVMGCIAGMTAGGMVLLAPLWPAAIVFLLCSVPPGIAMLLMSPHPHEQILGLACLIYIVTMGVFSYHAARTVRESIALRFENDALIGRLQEQTQRAFDAQQTAEAAQQVAEEASRAKAVFMAAASHDLRQPLHALGLMVSTLGRTGLTPAQHALLHKIDHAADAAGDLLSALLDFSKVDAGVIKPSPQVFALEPMLHKLEQEFTPQASAQGLVYRTYSTPKRRNALAFADTSLVERILRNLISNALRYTEHGSVLVGVRHRQDHVVVEVWDTGIGIPAAQHQAIFREFHQLGNPERDRRKGLGLGLAIVDGLAKSMHTTVTVHSVVGRGSVFRLTLPVGHEAAMLSTQDAPPSATSIDEDELRGVRVMVIDDDENVRDAMAELMGSWGLQCEGVESADEAMALLARFVPHIIVADYRLRGHRNGCEAIALVRAQAAAWGAPGIGALLVTGDTAADRLREAQASGLMLLHKPVPAARLRAALVNALPAAYANNTNERSAPHA